MTILTGLGPRSITPMRATANLFPATSPEIFQLGQLFFRGKLKGSGLEARAWHSAPPSNATRSGRLLKEVGI